IASPRLRVLARHRLAELRRAPCRRVLVEAVAQSLSGGVEDARVGVEVGEALREVDRLLRAVQRQVEPGHLADHRLGEALRLQREAYRLSVRDRPAPGAMWCSSRSSSV